MALPVQYFQKLVESCPDIIIAVDKQGTITFYNDGRGKISAFHYEEVLGKNVLEIYPSIDEARRVMAAMRAADGEGKGRMRNFETIFKTKKGEKIPVAISASIIYDDQGCETGSIGFAKDIREIRRRDQLVTLAEIAIGVSHEINNSLEVLVNQVDMLQQYVGRVANDEDYLVETDRLRVGGLTSEKNSGYHRTDQSNGRRRRIRHQRISQRQDDDRSSRRGRGQTLCDRPKADERYPLSGLRVLIVDDDAGICQSLKDLLEAERCCVETAASGVHAMNWLKHEKSDLVLSDVVMPDMDGYELYQTVKKTMPGLPVVLMTAFNYDKDHIIKRSCLEGLQGVIFKKPVNPALLKKILLQRCRPEQPQPKFDSSSAAEDHPLRNAKAS